MRTIRLVVALLALCACAQANDFYVDAGATAPGDGSDASPFPTIQQGVNATVNGRGDRILIQRGTYLESVNISNRDRLALVGVGTATIQGRSTGMWIHRSTNVTLENIVLRQCTTGVSFDGSNAVTFTRCRFLDNSLGLAGGSSAVNFLFRECDFCCQNGVAVISWGNNWTFERCTFVENATALWNFANPLTLRNCIVSHQTTAGIAAGIASQPTFNYNDFFQNGPDGNQHYGGYAAGANDLNVDPGYRDRARRDYSLREDSPLILAGFDDGPATIGAHEIGASAPLDTWTDADGTPVTNAGAKVVFENGALRLNGVATAATISPVIDLGNSGALTIRAVYLAFEDALQPTGSRRVIDQDPSTRAREFRVRASSTPFAALDPSPPWRTATHDEILSVAGRYVQMEFTLTTAGR